MASFSSQEEAELRGIAGLAEGSRERPDMSPRTDPPEGMMLLLPGQASLTQLHRLTDPFLSVASGPQA